MGRGYRFNLLFQLNALELLKEKQRESPNLGNNAARWLVASQLGTSASSLGRWLPKEERLVRYLRAEGLSDEERKQREDKLSLDRPALQDKLTPAQEQSLKEWLENEMREGRSPTASQVVEQARVICGRRDFFRMPDGAIGKEVARHTARVSMFVGRFKRRYEIGSATKRVRSRKTASKTKRSNHHTYEFGPPGLPQRPHLTEMDREQLRARIKLVKEKQAEFDRRFEMLKAEEERERIKDVERLEEMGRMVADLKWRIQVRLKGRLNAVLKKRYERLQREAAAAAAEGSTQTS